MINKWIIKDADGNITNPCILADEAFVQSISDYYEEFVEPALAEPTAEEEARQWRNNELSSTDYIVPLTDHPQHADYLSYRILLRNWPSTDSFPTTKPEL
jgi:hypothetical protein